MAYSLLKGYVEVHIFGLVSNMLLLLFLMERTMLLFIFVLVIFDSFPNMGIVLELSILSINFVKIFQKKL